MKGVKFMAIPKNEEEWTIYYELIKEYNENSVLDKATRHLIEAFKNDQTTRECWETFKEILHEFG